MKFWFDSLGWGYGTFTTSAGEHLNKRLKVYESEHTSQGAGRFEKILRMFRVSTIHYPNSMMQTERSLTCSACGGKGHTKKNKLCPNHIQEGMGNQDIAESDTEA